MIMIVMIMIMAPVLYVGGPAYLGSRSPHNDGYLMIMTIVGIITVAIYCYYYYY